MSLTPSRHRRKPPADQGSGAPRIENAAVERRKASWPQGWHVLLRRSTLKKLRHYGAPLPHFEGANKTRSALCRGANRKENLTLARISAARMAEHAQAKACPGLDPGRTPVRRPDLCLDQRRRSTYHASYVRSRIRLKSEKTFTSMKIVSDGRIFFSGKPCGA
jgi:hypothetical protein